MLQNLLASHDIVAQRDYLPKLKEIPVEVDEDEETVKLVQLVKSQEPLVSIMEVVMILALLLGLGIITLLYSNSSGRSKEC